jgi:hypothetical protein
MLPFFMALVSWPFVLQAQDHPADSSKSAWQFNLSGYYYWLPEENNFLQLTATADQQALHLETRYNYEDLNTASVFAGWKFETGKTVQFAATPMLGGVFGRTNGLAPGFELELSYKLFDLYSESEYLIDFSEHGNDYFYTWDELAISPVHFMRTGFTSQRTRVYSTGLDIQRGLFAEFSFWKLTTGVYYYNPFSPNEFGIFSLKVAF